MSIEKITSKIIKEAEDARDEVLADAKEKSDGILAEAKEKAEQHVKAEAERGRSEKEKIISRRKSVAEIDSRKVLLQKKQELIGQCFDRAIEEILSMEEQAYLQLLVNLGKKTGICLLYTSRCV